ncbi:MAG: hypothetical protein ACRDTQ_10600 [Micromonosporaceae bacterium]
MSKSRGPRANLEARLSECVSRGQQLDLADGEPVDESSMRGWDDSHAVPAELIREILRGRLAPDPDPRGLQLRGARIVGRLDLDNLTSAVPLELYDCLLSEGLSAVEASLSVVLLAGCVLEHPDGAPFDADRLRTTAGVFFPGTVITAKSLDGAVRLVGARVGGQLRCDGAKIRNESGPALHADGLQVDQDVHLRNQFEAVSTVADGAVRLLGARIGGQLVCSDATIRNGSGPALLADGLQVDEGVYLWNGFEAVGAGEVATVRLAQARISGRFTCGSGARIHNESGPALDCEALSARDVFLRDQFKAVGAGADGAVRLLSARIEGQLVCSGAAIRNPSGPALLGEDLQTGGDVFLQKDFEAVGAGGIGAVRLAAAHVGGQLNCSGARIRNESGPALLADRLRVDQDIYLGERFTALGVGEGGAVGLSGARVGGLLDCSGARIRNESGPALWAERLQVAEDVYFRDEFEAVGAGERGALGLVSTRVGGELQFSYTAVKNLTHPRARIELDGLTYSGVPVGPDVNQWLALLREATPAYASQPYQQLAVVCRAAGHDREVRQILMEQRRQQIRRRALTGMGARAWARFTGLALGYGYQPWRALIGLLVVVIVAVSICLTVNGALAHTKSSPSPGAGCTTVERIGVGLDLGLPLIKIQARAQCDVTGTSAGQALTAAGWLLQALAWAFATLFVAGFTAAVRRT